MVLSPLDQHRARMSVMFGLTNDNHTPKKDWHLSAFERMFDEKDEFRMPDMWTPTPGPPPPPPQQQQKSPPPPSPTPSTISITPSIQELADYINQLPKKADGLPSRNKLRKDKRLAAEISRKTGHLKVEKRGGRLRRFAGDRRLFDARFWAWLLDDDDHVRGDDGHEDGRDHHQDGGDDHETGDVHHERETASDGQEPAVDDHENDNDHDDDDHDAEAVEQLDVDGDAEFAKNLQLQDMGLRRRGPSRS